MNNDPIECFKIVGELKPYFYTSDGEPITVAGVVYEPLEGLTRTAIELTAITDSLQTVDILVPITSDIAVDYALREMPVSFEVEIRNVDRDTDEIELVYQGEYVSIEVIDNYVSIKTQSIIQAQLNNQTNQVVLGTSCNHVLYDALCKVDIALHTFTTTVLAIKGTKITVVNDFVGNDALQVGLMVNTRTGETRTITSNIDNIIRVGYDFIDIIVGDEVNLIRGCNHKYNTCKNVFNNVPNYGGFMWLPTTNPYENEI